MKNREQVRAKNALDALPRIKEAKGERQGDVLTGLPALIVGNGLLAALAFAKSKSKWEKDDDGKETYKKSGHEKICDEIAAHLAHDKIGLLRGHEATTDGLIEFLTSSDSEQLRLCTAEALAFLNYLRRFARAQR